MATDRQIQTNRANATRSTGPVTPEGKRICSRNAALRGLLSGTVVLKGESIRRFNGLAAALILQFQPRNSAETALVQTMTVARWRLLRMWGIQTAGFQLEMARQDPSAGSGAVLPAVTFRSLADNSRRPRPPASLRSHLLPPIQPRPCHAFETARNTRFGCPCLHAHSAHY